MVKRIFGAIWMLWTAIVFLTTMLIFWIPIWAIALWDEPKRTDLFMKLIRVWMGIFLSLAGIRMKVTGKEKFKNGENYIVTCNHKSMMDVPLSSPGIPGANKTIAKMELSKIPLFGMVYKRGSILVDRNTDASRKDAFNRMKWALEKGMHMCIYPEGTRNKSTNPLKSFQDGAFRLAIQTGKPIMPAVIFNTEKVLPADKSFYVMPHAVSMHFLDPVYIEPGDSAESLKQKIYNIMETFIIENRSKWNY
jgi:1-acyl-sn-glycerol-3-phosphate acyltransferase